MRKIMIYSKKRIYSPEGLYDSLKNNASVILLFVCFCCGAATGCVVIKNASLFADDLLIRSLHSQSYFLHSAVYAAVVLCVSFFGGLSCCGPFIQIVISFLHGAVTSASVSAFLHDGIADGFGKYCLSLFIGNVVMTCAIILYGADCMKVSGEICCDLFLMQNEKIEIRVYIIKTLIAIALCGIALLINALCVRLFI